MRKEFLKLIQRSCAFILILTLMTMDCAAIVKDVEVWGARSINDQGYSDNRITMDDLKDDYADFNQTDGLREYFHRDQEDPYKVDLSEAMSWLIDHEIICRDQQVTVNINTKDGVPDVTIDKMDVVSIGTEYVHRSDIIMYLYKAVFGPMDARTVGIETPNIRTDDGTFKTLLQIMQDNHYMAGVSEHTVSGLYQTSTNGTDGEDGEHSSDGQGGAGGQGESTVTEYLNNENNWHYTPQGDEYQSIFGDTNIFINQSQNEFHQTSTGGNGGNGGRGTATANGGDGGDGSTSVVGGDEDTPPVSASAPGGSGGSADASASGGNGGDGGSATNIINYETDYKQICYILGADLMFYRTNDVLELYIRAALSKGLLDDEVALRTENFREVFLTDMGTTLPSWSAGAPAYIVNRSKNKQVTSIDVAYAPMSSFLGVNFDIDYHDGMLSIVRRNLFDANSGYFVTEKVYKMDIYRYIYRFVSANEKKLSDLEVDIVNYKYGMELDGTTQTEEDLEILKYLIAKGILNFDDTEDFLNLYLPITWDSVIPILYRVANPNARLDFSLVQLTDSESSWRAKGYAPQTLYVVSGSAPSAIQFEWNPELTVTVNDDDEDTPLSVELIEATVSFSSDGTLQESSMTPEEILNMVVTQSLSDDGLYQQVRLGAYTLGSAQTTGTVGDVIIPGGYTLGFKGALRSWKGSTESNLMMLTRMEASEYERLCAAGAYSQNQARKTEIVNEFCKNIWVIAALQKDPETYAQVLEYLNSQYQYWAAETPVDSAIDVKDAYSRSTGYCTLMNELKANVEGDKAPSGFKVAVKDFNGGITTWSSSQPPSLSGFTNQPLDIFLYLVNNIVEITYSVPTSLGTSQQYAISFFDLDSSVSGANENEIVPLVDSRKCTLTMYVTDQGNVADHTIIDWTGVSIVRKNAVNALASQTGSQSANDAVANGARILTFAGENQNFVSWSQIVSYNNGCTDSSQSITIQRVSDLVLYNPVTETYAYLSTNGQKIALVGTDIVTGDSELGVAFKTGDGASAEYYYHIDVIRLLMNAKQESAVLSGVRTLQNANRGVLDNVQTVPLLTNSGHQESALVGFKALLSSNDSSSLNYTHGEKLSVYTHLEKENGTRWGRFLSLTQANRAINAISRRISYKLPSSGDVMTAYAVVVFEPVNIEDTGSAMITANMSMQDLLDSAVKPPNSASGQQKYAENMELCNAYANWVYGTTGKEYIKTGYLEPKAYLYYIDNTGLDGMPQSIWGALTGQQISKVQPCHLSLMADGAMCKLNQYITLSNGKVPEANVASYYLADDYKVIVLDDRVYLNEWCFKNLRFSVYNSTPAYYYNYSAGRRTSFTLGSTFKFTETINPSVPWASAIKATVIETKSDGTVVCQVGPVVGFPVKYGTTTAIVNSGDFSVNATAAMTFTSLELNQYDFRSSMVNRLEYVKDEILSKYEHITVGNIVSSPYVLLSNSVKYVYVGSKFRVYTGQTGASSEVNIDPLQYNLSATNTLQDVMNSWRTRIAQKVNNPRLNLPSVDNTETYLQISFKSYEYTIRDGFLYRDNATVSDYLSADLFTNLNDLIINDMIDESHGAIPINSIPSGAFLKAGHDYYVAVGSSEATKKFVGYSYLDSATSSYRPTKQDIARSFAGHFVLAGNEYVNISHFFTSMDVMIIASGARASASEAEKQALHTIVDCTMSFDGRNKLAVLPDGATIMLRTPTDATAPADRYAMARITFDNSLYVYQSATYSTASGEIPVYTVCSNVRSSISGDFSELSFFTDSILEASLMDVTSSVVAGTYAPFAGDASIMNAIREEFAAAFTGDLFTLLRFLVFIVIIWLFIASWICFGCYVGRLMPIIDAISRPTRDAGSKGLDLFKLISLGTISVDTEFELGRFMLYDIILALLMIIVWKSGSLIL